MPKIITNIKYFSRNLVVNKEIGSWWQLPLLLISHLKPSHYSSTTSCYFPLDGLRATPHSENYCSLSLALLWDGGFFFFDPVFFSFQRLFIFVPTPNPLYPLVYFPLQFCCLLIFYIIISIYFYSFVHVWPECKFKLKKMILFREDRAEYAAGSSK